MYEDNVELVKFQSTPPREGRQKTLQAYREDTLFQSTPPREGRHDKVYDYRHPIWFQSTPPREGRHPHFGHVDEQAYGFNPRPRVRGDVRLISDRSALVSFNPRPRVRGDHPENDKPAFGWVFQSTPPREGRPRAEVRSPPMQTVSIHAPA